MTKERICADLKVVLEINDIELAQSMIDESVNDGFKVISFCKTITLGDRTPQKINLEKLDIKDILLLQRLNIVVNQKLDFKLSKSILE